MKASIVIGLPSKGRMKEQALNVFSKAGLAVQLSEDQRNYRGIVPNMPDVEIAFMSASEIARELAAGTLHLGITGEDLAREKIALTDEKLTFEVKLDFGYADVIVGVPEAWIDVVSMDDLRDVAASFRKLYGRQLRVGTKYFSLTTAFFSAQHGIDHYRIVESLGATEGAPASGASDIIVDITSTGSTLKANQLKVLSDGIILASQANLIASKTAPQTADQSVLIDDIIQAIKKNLR